MFNFKKRPLRLKLQPMRLPKNFPDDGLWDAAVKAALNYTFKGHIHPVSSDLEWASKDKRMTKIKDMATRHIINTIRLINRKAHKEVSGGTMWNALMDELTWRKKAVACDETDFTDIPENEELSDGGIFLEH